MAKVAPFTKLKSMIKCCFTKVDDTNNSAKLGAYSTVDSLGKHSSSIPTLGLETVYVGKCRRAYQISSQLIKHPSFKGLIINTSEIDGCGIRVACEVVLFEHLLWMLQSIDPQTESLDDLVAFYA